MPDMEETSAVLAPPIDPDNDHCQGTPEAPVALVEYGSYACKHCRQAQAVIERVRERLGDELVYVFRHKPLARDPWAVPTALLAEAMADRGRFFEAHAALMATPIHSRADLEAVATTLGIEPSSLDEILNDPALQQRVTAADESARAAGVKTTPTFLINNQHYDGAWDEMSLLEALDRPVAHQADRMMRAFAGWAPATGVLLALAAVVALFLANSPFAAAYQGLWDTVVTFNVGGRGFGMTLGHWINDALMAIFFLVVGLEIKREITIGTLSDPRDAMLPAAAALGGMIVPAALFLAVTWDTAASDGWGIPMATDIAFSLGLLSLLGRRVPLRLKVFLTALAIVDDLGAIVAIAVFYGHGFEPAYAMAALACFGLLVAMNWAGVYSTVPYAVLGVVLWYLVYASGVHATLAGILLAIAVPTRPPPNLKGLLAQAQAIIDPEIDRLAGAAAQYPQRQVIRALDAVHDRIESPAHRLERTLEPWSSFLILPLFALANAGVALDLGGIDAVVIIGIGLGLIVGKPLGIVGTVWLAVRMKLLDWPAGFNWVSLTGVAALAGVGFTMSLFIANEAFGATPLGASAKLAVLGASVCSAVIGVVLLARSLPQVGERSG